MWTREMAQQQCASKVICGNLNVTSRTHVNSTLTVMPAHGNASLEERTQNL